MKLSKIFTLTSAILAMCAGPVLAQSVDLDGWDFNSKPEMVERLKETKETLNSKINEAQQANNTGLVNELQQARQNVQNAIDNVQAADQEQWDYTLTSVEEDLNDYDYYDYGVWDDGYWENDWGI